MPHFFVNSENLKNNKITISDSENYKHIAKSLRIRVGEKLLLIDENREQYETKVIEVGNNSIVCSVECHYKSCRDLKFNLYLAQSPLRSDAQSFVIEKATELGVRAVIPVITDNCALSSSVVEKKIDRWNRIMYEASKQCERATIPSCESIENLENLLKSDRFDKIIAFCERKAEFTLRDYVEENPITKNENVLLIIGPEGGFSEREFLLFDKYSIPQLTLGNLILKAETAVTVALGNLIYEYETCRKN